VTVYNPLPEKDSEIRRL